MKHPVPGHHRLIRLAGPGFVLLSVVSIGLSLGAPGLGWAMATVTMVAASLCARLVGQAWLAVCLALTAVHVLTLGPLGGGAGSSFGSEWVIGVLFTGIPFIAGMGALAATCLRSRK
jgi:hypothetical protein